jgi:formyltetrahydrofolate-dependent phosphoribosylglycinamide formyltransferase
MAEMESKPRLVVLASGFGSNLQAIIDSCTTGELPAEVVAIVSDQPEAYALERARSIGTPAVYHPWKPYQEEGKDRRTYDADLAALVLSYRPTLVILAGWMRILTSAFLHRFPMQVINLHPALPGMFPGTHAIERAWDQFQKGDITHTGVMVHYVPDEGVDDGPLILQEEVSILSTDNIETLEARIHKVEHRLLINAIGLALD